MRIAYIDCWGGASGDMLLGAILDCGLPLADLLPPLRSLKLPGWSLEASVVTRGHLRATQAKVQVTAPPQPRGIREIESIIGASRLPQTVADRSWAVFQRLAAVEAKIHQIPLEKVHFHELGAVDTIIDVVGTVLGFHLLGIEKIYFSALPVGKGVIFSAHGSLPNPAPATMELCKGIPLYGIDVEGEMVTPTGAALLTTLGEYSPTFPPTRLTALGYGAGSRESSFPNLLRLCIGESPGEIELPADTRGGTAITSFGLETQYIWILETVVDDLNPERLPFLCDRLLEAGALDVWYRPVQMKKGRPGQEIVVLAESSTCSHLLHLLYSESTTLGVRVRAEHRYILPRHSEEIQTSLGTVKIKKSFWPAADGNWRSRIKPEFESCRALAEKHRLPLEEVYAAVWEALTTKNE